MPRPSLLSIVFTLLLSGCAVRQLTGDQDKMRAALLELYTNQVMDNLVRAINGLPIIQLDYSNANSQVTVDANATIGDGLATSHANTLAVIALKSLLVTRTLGNTLMGGTAVTHTNLVGLTATPVTTSNELYDAYLRYLAEPGSLQITATPPPDGAAHLCVRCDKEYYWVPSQFKDLFFKLATITTAQRGEPLFAPDEFYRVRLLDFADPLTAEQLLNQLHDDRRIDDELFKKVRKDLPGQLGDLESFAALLEKKYCVDHDTIVTFKAGQLKNGTWVLHLKLDKVLPVDNGTMLLPGSDPKKPINVVPFRVDLKVTEYKSNLLTMFLRPDNAPPGLTSRSDFRFPIPARLTLECFPQNRQPTTRELLELIPFRTPQVSLDAPAAPTPQAVSTGRGVRAPQAGLDGEIMSVAADVNRVRPAATLGPVRAAPGE